MTDSTNSSIKMPIRRMNVDELDNNTTAILNTQRTNCITEIPQDIKLELLNGKLKVLAGSKVYVPNGFEADGTTPKFNEVITTVDLTIRSSVNTQIMIFYRSDNTIGATTLLALSSGTTQPSGTGYWYDTTNNIIRRIIDGAVTTSNHSFPLAILTCDSTQISSIDQVFNGFGYIGSTVFALPGVKGLIPNGRNEDGSLKNIELTVGKVLSTTYTSARNGILGVSSSWVGISNSMKYNKDENFNIDSNGKSKSFIFGNGTADNTGIITSFQPKTTFQVLDYNNSAWIAQQAMPSNKYDALTLGASGTQYTAPANGYFCIARTATATEQILQVEGSFNGFETWSQGAHRYSLTVPVRKGAGVYVYYTMPTAGHFVFLYAEGEN